MTNIKTSKIFHLYNNKFLNYFCQKKTVKTVVFKIISVYKTNDHQFYFNSLKNTVHGNNADELSQFDVDYFFCLFVLICGFSKF